MSKLILNPELNLYECNGQAFCSSRQVAEEFKKRHDNVLQDIRELDCSKEFFLLNFQEKKYKGKRSEQPEYLMTKDGFTFLVMGYRGKKAAQFKEAYIRRFNAMEQFIKSRYAARLESRDLTAAVKLLHDPPKDYHYSNEFDMINRIVFGMSSKQFQLQHGLQKDAPIRDHMTPEQIDAIQKLQAFDTHLAKVMPDYKQRQGLLQEYYRKINEPKKLALTGA